MGRTFLRILDLKLGVALVVLSLPGLAGAASFSSETALRGEQYAPENSPSTRVDLNLRWLSDDALPGTRIPLREFRFDSFFEAGPGGDRSIDPTVAVLRFATGESGHFWVGRTHPATEGLATDTGTEVIRPTSALGANWVQNQSDALTPRVSGWIGAGLEQRIGSTSAYYTVALSPIYLPGFGPRVNYSAFADASGARFGRLPPEYVDLNGSLFPLRYQINTGDLLSIVLQPQAFTQIGTATRAGDFRLMAWSAPTPNPQVDTSGLLRVGPNDLNVLVTAKPRFPRENFLGFRWNHPRLALAPELETVYEAVSGRLTVSARMQLLSILEAGVLHSVQTQPLPPADGPTIDSPIYAQDLVWTELALHPQWRPLNRLTATLRLERHFLPGREDLWLRPGADYLAARNLHLTAWASVIAGDDPSYFGTWRDLDSVGAGVRYLW